MKLRIGMAFAMLLLVVISVARPGRVEAVGGCIPGSYLAAEGSGTRSLWTFSSDGTFQVASSAEKVFDFSHIQGTWERHGADSVRAVGLDFGLLPEPVGNGVPPEWITRIDVLLAFSRDCGHFAGEFELRFYEEGEDPLEPTAVASDGRDTVNGRRIEVP